MSGWRAPPLKPIEATRNPLIKDQIRSDLRPLPIRLTILTRVCRTPLAWRPRAITFVARRCHWTEPRPLGRPALRLRFTAINQDSPDLTRPGWRCVLTISRPPAKEIALSTVRAKIVTPHRRIPGRAGAAHRHSNPACTTCKALHEGVLLILDRAGLLPPHRGRALMALTASGRGGEHVSGGGRPRMRTLRARPSNHRDRWGPRRAEALHDAT
jgi:hypothetical protein